MFLSLPDSNMILTPSAEESEVRTSSYNTFLDDFLLKYFSVAIHVFSILPPSFLGISHYKFPFFHIFSPLLKISVWDLRAASKRIAVVKQDRKDQLGGGQVAERGMVFSLLLQSRYGNGISAMKKKFVDFENEDSVSIQESVASGSIISTSVPRFMAGYEDGSISCFDIRTFRYALNIII